PPQVVDNCPEGSRSTFQGIGSGKAFPLGTSAEIYTYVAGDGTRLECSFNVTVEKRIDADIQVRDATCPGVASGAATVTIDSEEPYTYRWSDGQQTQSAVNLRAGSYSVTVSSANECTFERDFFVGEPSELFIRLDSIVADATSNVFVTVLGGTPPYRYEWTNSDGQMVSSVQDPANLPLGTYQIKVTDNNGCISSNSIRADMSTATRDFIYLKGLEIGPNPSAGNFYLQFKRSFGRVAKVEIHSIAGQLIYRQNTTVASITNINPGTLEAGFYLVTIQLNGERLTKRLVVK
ncbi:MAG: T9SS type A sorting domain-containing protein, partial [Saprospiraceae bacterium]|nr:T9SS type A sorting domain-containing protein [Saprospiraceae bacterium]